MAAKNNSFSSRLLHNAGIFNPVLVQAVGLCPVIAMATTLRGAALLALVATVTITLSEFIASAFLKVIPRWVRTGIYIIIGGSIVTPFMMLIEKVNPELFGSLGIYLPIMAVNSLLVLRCERFAVKLKPLSALADGFTASIGYAAVLVLVGILRELLGSGSIAGFQLFKNMAIPGLLLPFGGFLMIGFAAAALRTFISAYFPKYLDKKQPKPGKKHRPKTDEPKPVPVLPDLTPEEDPFSFDEIAALPEDEITQAPQIPDEQPAMHIEAAQPEIQAEPMPEPAAEPESSPEAISEPQVEPAAEPEPAAETIEPAEEAPLQEEPAEASAEPQPEHQPEHSEFKELTFEEAVAPSKDEIEQPAPVEPQPETAYSKRQWTVPTFDDDDELERLMNRSMDEVFSKNKEGEDK